MKKLLLILFFLSIIHGCSSGSQEKLYQTFKGPQTNLTWSNESVYGKHVNNPTGPYILKKRVLENLSIIMT